MSKKQKMVMAVSVFLLSFGGMIYGQSYTGVVTQAANLRSGPGTDYGVLTVLAEGTRLVIDSIADENGFYSVVVIETDTLGWIAKSLVNLVGQNESIFSPSGRTANKEAVIKIQNDSKLIMTLTIDGKIYIFGVGEEKVLELPAGSYRVRASAPGIRPYVGVDTFEAYSLYTVKFYVTSSLGL
jgi:uncharacterized protein YgiM (DUF1202 family)